MRSSLIPDQLAAYTCRQFGHFFPDHDTVATDLLMEAIPQTLQRVEHCFSRINNKYFFDGGDVVFNHRHGDQYAMYLYFLSNTVHRLRLGIHAAEKAYLLNKALHGIDAYYEVELPSVFLFVHPLATVLGRGRYSDYLLVYQRCGVGSNHDVFPTLDEHVTLRPGAAVLGRSHIGARSTIAAESLVLDLDVPADTVYIGKPKDRVLKRASGPLPVWRDRAPPTPY